ncbi:hypothetical protein QAD02_007879 [Eretmocerus hayati]|uniref:Uncharacterized protein n=1 Tax=Eretmocerus hayati TaxID=131215 RepID=A0ACC2N567_9HYME|nr:hypothetical protein QAD02_007879 [Eretmocerus hayati]
MDAAYWIHSAEVLHTGEKRETEKKRIARGAHRCISFGLLRRSPPHGRKTENGRKRIARGAHGRVLSDSLSKSPPHGRKTENGEKNGSHGERTDAPYLFPSAEVLNTGRKRGTEKKQFARGTHGCISFRLLSQCSPHGRKTGNGRENGSHVVRTDACYSIPSAGVLYTGKNGKKKRKGSHGERTDASHLVFSAKVLHTGEKRGTEKERIARGALGCVLFDSLSRSPPHGEETGNAEVLHTGEKRETEKRRIARGAHRLISFGLLSQSPPHGRKTENGRKWIARGAHGRVLSDPLSRCPPHERKTGNGRKRIARGAHRFILFGLLSQSPPHGRTTENGRKWIARGAHGRVLSDSLSRSPPHGKKTGNGKKNGSHGVRSDACYSIPSAEVLYTGKKREEEEERIARETDGCISFGLLSQSPPHWKKTKKNGSHGELTDASHLVSSAKVLHTGEKRGTERERIARGSHGCVLFDSPSRSPSHGK